MLNGGRLATRIQGVAAVAKGEVVIDVVMDQEWWWWREERSASGGGEWKEGRGKKQRRGWKKREKGPCVKN